MDKKPRIIAFYLPQFHPIPENDEWWGKGFTEWTNVGKAKPLFRGHYQPRVPADLGYYDLRLSEVREAQAELARKAGIEGFCYWHYWFGNGKRLLERPFNEVLASGKPDFPFCLGWANESWQAKLWNTDESKNKVLIEQKYLGEEDNEHHFNTLKRAFEDGRYIRKNDRLVFFVYKPLQLNNAASFLKQWNDLLKKSKIAKSFYFVAQANAETEYQSIIDLGFDAITILPTKRMQQIYTQRTLLCRLFVNIYRKINHMPLVLNYKDVYPYLFDSKFDSKEDVIPFILPNWDHSSRSGGKACVLHNSTPSLFREHIKQVLAGVCAKENKLIFLKSWNEWGEGNYIEPDLRWGDSYLSVLRDEINNNFIEKNRSQV